MVGRFRLARPACELRGKFLTEAPPPAFSPTPLVPRGTSCWLLTDGKAGDETQGLGLAEALGLKAELRHVAPRKFYAWAMPYGPIDPREAPDKPGSPLAPPFPDLAFAAGRRAVAYLRALKRLSRGHTFTVFINDPYGRLSFADVVVLPEHDRRRGPNVITAATPANRVSDAALDAARQTPDPWLDGLPKPRVALLLGGPSRHHRYGGREALELAAIAKLLAAKGKGLMVTASRRTPARLLYALRAAVGERAFIWDGTGDNPYLGILARADAILVTADSINMAGEAVATGKPVHFYEPSGGHRKIDAYLDELEELGAIRRWSGQLETWRYAPINATPALAAEIARRYRKFRGLD